MFAHRPFHPLVYHRRTGLTWNQRRECFRTVPSDCFKTWRELSGTFDKFFRALFNFRPYSYSQLLVHGFVLVRHLPSSSPFNPRRTPASLGSIPENCYRIFRLTWRASLSLFRPLFLLCLFAPTTHTPSWISFPLGCSFLPLTLHHHPRPSFFATSFSIFPFSLFTTLTSHHLFPLYLFDVSLLSTLYPFPVSPLLSLH